MARRVRATKARRVREQLAENPASMFDVALSKHEVDETCTFLLHAWRDRLFTPMVTLWTFLVQVLTVGASCNAAVMKVLSFLSVTKGLVASHDGSAYCRARKRLPLELLVHLTKMIAQRLAAKVPQEALWHGHRIKLVDGSTVSMPDTPANQRVYPQPNTQKPGCGFPKARVVGVFDLLTGAVLDLAMSSLHVGEPALFRRLWDGLDPGDVAVADRYYSSYADIALLQERGVLGLWRLHQCRKADFRKGTRLGPDDRLVTWEKPHRPRWLSKTAYDALPKTLSVRLVRVRCTVPGWRAETVIVATTLLDPKLYPAQDVAALYLRRWEVETDFAHLMTTLHTGVLRTKSPDIIERELWAHLLAYNLIRTVMWEAASRRGIEPLRLSLKGAVDEFVSVWPYSATATNAAALQGFYDSLLYYVARRVIPHRPGRSEPRVRKRHPKSYPAMTVPRAQCRKTHPKRKP